MGPTKDSTNISQTSLKQRHLQPYSNAAVSATSEHDSSVARKNSPHQHTTSHVSAATDKLPNELAYLFWNATTTANESVAWQEHQPRVWSCYTGSPNSAKCSSATASMNARAVSSECKGETCPATAQDLSKASLTIHGKAIIKKTTKSVAQPQPRSSEDDKSELQNLIRSYAGSMLYHSDAPEEQGTDVVSEFLGEENPAIGQVAKEEIKAEVELATRVMNRSLGG
ncbi:hypothetical protein DM02DRAFT_610165 [Periconia macrospinosa]|uniref:Uncharacterized protein n=1 Tax=Periconia macrospinosa TaxID=97972 RepID=A0A2V1E6T5_9PLEO|nr:hypothetical protein DM02DRAFT_610165 [Periconia macrospinosa]